MSCTSRRSSTASWCSARRRPRSSSPHPCRGAVCTWACNARGVLLASLGDSFSAFFDAVGSFFDSLAAIHWLSLFVGLIAFGIYLSIRARASFHILRAAYGEERIQFRYIWGAYIA